MSFVKVDIEQKIEQKRTEDEQFKSYGMTVGKNIV